MRYADWQMGLTKKIEPKRLNEYIFKITLIEIIKVELLFYA